MITFIARFHIVFDATLMLASFAANIKSNPVKTADTAVTDPGEEPGVPSPLFLDLRVGVTGDPPNLKVWIRHCTEGTIESVHIDGVSVLIGLNLEKMQGVFFSQGHGKLSVITRFPYSAGGRNAGLECNSLGSRSAYY